MHNALTFLDDPKRYGTDPDLTKIKDALDDLGHPERAFRVVHIAGTNGKGSTGAMLSSILQSAGKKVGHFTSPHVLDFRERMRINGDLPTEEAFCNAAQTLEQKFPSLRHAQELKAFTLQMFAAMLLFAQEEVDYALFEVGIGGQDDPTNVLDTALSIITPIGFDHMGRLGNTLPEIAAHKAGIIKKDTPVVVGIQVPEALHVIEERAKAQHAPVHLIQGTTEFLEEENGGVRFLFRPLNATFVTGMGGHYQKDNAACAIVAAQLLEPQVTFEQLQKGVHQGTLPSRMQRIPSTPPVILDGAHNIHGIETFVNEQGRRKNTIGIIGMMKDKESQHILELWRQAFETLYLVPVNDTRSWSPKTVKENYFADDRNVLNFEGWEAALKHALKENPTEIYVMGSFYLAGDVLHAWEDNQWTFESSL